MSSMNIQFFWDCFAIISTTAACTTILWQRILLPYFRSTEAA